MALLDMLSIKIVMVVTMFSIVKMLKVDEDARPAAEVTLIAMF